MKASETAVQTLRERALRIRMRIVDLVGIGRAGHLGGSCSLADIMAALYFYKMRLQKEDPKWPGRDRLIEQGACCTLPICGPLRAGHS